MGEITERTGLLRILLADEDDANAFLFQCGVNRLARPCAFQRVAKREQLAGRVQSFCPNILIASGRFAEPEELQQIKQLTNGHPIICAVKTPADGEAAMAAGASDCVLVSQVDELHACIERRLSGAAKTPYFKKDLVEKAPAKKAPSKLDVKLEEFDRWVGRTLRWLGGSALEKSRKLARASRLAWCVSKRAARRKYRALRVQWLLHKQKRLMQAGRGIAPKTADAGIVGRGAMLDVVAAPSQRGAEVLRHQARGEDHPVALRASELPKVKSLPKPAEEAVTAPKASAEAADNETLRTLEISFKTIFHTALDPMFLLDGLGSFLHANAPACALLGVAPADLLGKSLLDFVPMNERPQVSATWEALLIEGQQKTETRLQSASGELREVYVSARANLWFGVHLLIARDQTELKNLRNAVREQQHAA